MDECILYFMWIGLYQDLYQDQKWTKKLMKHTGTVHTLLWDGILSENQIRCRSLNLNSKESKGIIKVLNLSHEKNKTQNFWPKKKILVFFFKHRHQKDGKHGTWLDYIEFW